MCNSYRIKLVTGIPRSGTTLVCKMAYDVDNTISLTEPMNPFVVPEDKIEAIRYIANFIFDIRYMVNTRHIYPSKANNGEIVDNFLQEDLTTGKLRKSLVKDQLIHVDKQLQKDFMMIVKQNAFFTALLPDIQDFFEIYVVIRNPLAVLLSWNSIDLPVNKGRIPAAERYDKILKDVLSNIDNTIQRQIKILDWFFQKYDKYVDKKHIIRYEELIEGTSKPFRLLTGEAPLQNKLLPVNKKREQYYNLEQLECIYSALTKTKHVSKFYSELEIKEYYENLLK